jgi:hypothetical protein
MVKQPDEHEACRRPTDALYKCPSSNAGLVTRRVDAFHSWEALLNSITRNGQVPNLNCSESYWIGSL